MRLSRFARFSAAGVAFALVFAFVGQAGTANASTLYLSKTTDSLSINQYDIITATPANGLQVQVTANSSPSVASATTTGTIDQVQVQGLLAGSTTVTICTTDQSECSTVYVTVAGGSSSTLNFTNQDPTVASGQTTSIGTTNAQASTLTVSSNSNPSAVGVTTAGQNLTVTGVTYGSSSITVCATGTSQCGTLYVTVGSGSSSGSSITFSSGSPSVSIGQSTVVSVYGGSGSYYVSANTNSGVATTSLSGANLTIYGEVAGTTNATICDSNSTAGCATMLITVGNTSSGVTFSNADPSVGIGQSSAISIYGSGSYYVSTNTNSSVVSPSLNGSTITLYGSTSGSTNIAICEQANGSICGTLYVTVNGSSSSSAITFSTSNPSVTTGQTVSVAVYGGSSYYISQNTSPTIVSATVSGTNLNLYGIAGGTSAITVCNLLSISQCSTVTATVNSGATSGGAVTFLTTSLPNATLGTEYSDSISVTGGSPPYTYEVYSGILPAGLSLSTTGQITGVPTVEGSGSFTVRAADELGNAAIENLSLTVQAASSIAEPTGGTTGTAIDGYHDGALINDGGTIYVINNGTKTPFTSAAAFTGLGYSFGSVVNGSTSNIPLSGTVVSSSSAAHPAGSWIDSSGTVYFVTTAGIIPVPSASVFTANNGSWSLVVPANAADLTQTVLGVMVAGDSRVE